MPWQKGQSGNPAGRRPEDDSEVRALARKHTPAAIRTLVKWMKSGNAKAAVTAAQALLDRGHGKPSQPIDAKVDATVGYTAQPIPVEQRHTDTVASPARAAVNGHSA